MLLHSSCVKLAHAPCVCIHMIFFPLSLEKMLLWVSLPCLNASVIPFSWNSAILRSDLSYVTCCLCQDFKPRHPVISLSWKLRCLSMRVGGHVNKYQPLLSLQQAFPFSWWLQKKHFLTVWHQAFIKLSCFWNFRLDNQILGIAFSLVSIFIHLQLPGLSVNRVCQNKHLAETSKFMVREQ